MSAITETTSRDFTVHPKNGDLYCTSLRGDSILLVYANWCGYCTRFKPDYLDASRGQMFQDYHFAQLNHDESDIIRKLNAKGIVKSYPTVLYIKDGNVSQAVKVNRDIFSDPDAKH